MAVCNLPRTATHSSPPQRHPCSTLGHVPRRQAPLEDPQTAFRGHRGRGRTLGEHLERHPRVCCLLFSYLDMIRRQLKVIRRFVRSFHPCAANFVDLANRWTEMFYTRSRPYNWMIKPRNWRVSGRLPTCSGCNRPQEMRILYFST
jgi:hypothetical protein